ncbi:hypothetical protein JRO89_XS04G0136400 [Xanthoceras sorbifolium]|uniref:RNase H type-1 domain-containing protein n=1 Tax=Xanthoceras sorbifolium TaxID=99658 RepID=A0ABQ8I563_9ROSI|nr:hypothetical protein JRO89_XS04G0136400 [Xanthoceras sorbifolium]
MGLFFAEVEEYIALREDLMLAKHLQVPFQWVEVEASNVISRIYAKDSSLDVVGCIIDDIKSLCAEVRVVKCHAIPRDRNIVPHTLAARAVSSYEDDLWLDARPFCVSSLS